jgi:hypothetical protein
VDGLELEPLDHRVGRAAEDERGGQADHHCDNVNISRTTTGQQEVLCSSCENSDSESGSRVVVTKTDVCAVADMASAKATAPRRPDKHMTNLQCGANLVNETNQKRDNNAQLLVADLVGALAEKVDDLRERRDGDNAAKNGEDLQNTSG